MTPLKTGEAAQLWEARRVNTILEDVEHSGSN